MDVNQQGSESPPVRSTILGNLLRGRRQSHSHERETSPDPPSPSMPQAAGGGFSQMLRRRRSGGVGGAAQPSSMVPASPAPSPTTISAPIHQSNGSIALAAGSAPSSGLTHRIRLVPHLDSRRSLKFDAITRDVREGDQPVRIGRFTERSNPATAAHANATTSGKVAFKSKVVSRTHAEIWVEAGGKFFIRDTKSSSGTFLNHLRLSPANTESTARLMRDGDILQLGVDYQGGTEDIYKSVKIRVEVGREWQGHKNVFNTSALKNLKSLATPGKSGNSNNIPDCCICLFAVSIRQALFIAPCSHTFHYKCIRPLLESHHPAFSCPLCRTFADLDEDVEVELDVVEESEQEDDDSGKEKPIAVDLVGKQKQREERERERERDAGAETEVETDVHRDISASRRRSRMEMMEEEEDRFNTNTWIMDADAGSSGEAIIPVGRPTVGGDEDVIMHVEDKNAQENPP